MKFRIYLILAICALGILAQSFLTSVEIAPLVEAQTQQRKDASAVVANVPVEATLLAGQTKLPIKGNLSLNLEISPEQLKAGTVDVRGFNIVFFGVNQAAISGKETAVKNGVLGMSIPASAKNLQMRYDAKSQTLTGEIPVQAHFPQLDEIFPPEFNKGSREDDFAVSKTQRGKVKIQIKFTEALDKSASSAALSKKMSKLTGEATTKVEMEPLQDSRFPVAAYRIDVNATRFPLDIGVLTIYETGSRLCVQPVRIRSSASDATPTGAGLAFGMPGATTQWNKADVVFQVRAWMTVTNASLKVATAGDEEVSIRGLVNADDCIEVFFVQNFDPVSLHGGGATWSGGTANAKIISSDGNVGGGIDFTHLAHELGHVLNMGHPGDPRGMYDPSTNSLMCPSGWLRDNPTRNSRNNASNVANPLLTVILKPRTPGADCTASADCGACPF